MHEVRQVALGAPQPMETFDVSKPCPYCGRQPDISLCEPRPSHAGPQPWYAGCYWPGEREHFVEANGDTRADAERGWEREVAKHTASPVR
jgi:hypothetical protein